MQANFAATGFAAAELMNAPRRQGETAKSNMGAQQQEVSDAAAAAAENGFQTRYGRMQNFLNQTWPTKAQAPQQTQKRPRRLILRHWMVSRSTKPFIYDGDLVLLPGAVLTNLKGYLAYGLLHISQDEDAVSPFSGILRSIIAIS